MSPTPDWAWAEKRLRHSHNCWLATVRGDGRSHLVLIRNDWLERRFWFSSFAGVKVDNFAACPAVVLTTETPGEGVTLDGTAETVGVCDLPDGYAGTFDAKIWPRLVRHRRRAGVAFPCAAGRGLCVARKRDHSFRPLHVLTGIRRSEAQEPLGRAAQGTYGRACPGPAFRPVVPLLTGRTFARGRLPSGNSGRPSRSPGPAPEVAVDLQAVLLGPLAPVMLSRFGQAWMPRWSMSSE